MTLPEQLELLYVTHVLGVGRVDAIGNCRRIADTVLAWYEELGVVEPRRPAPPAIADQLELVLQ